MKNLTLFILLSFFIQTSYADEFSDTIKIFKKAGQSASFFKKSYGYALFPTIAKAGLFVGGAYGDGRVYKKGRHTGNSTMKQVSIGFQAGGQAFSQIIFFKNSKAYKQFTSGDFEFGAQASAVVITAGAQASTTTTGSSAGASGGKNDAKTVGKYNNGMVVFTVAKGGLMYEATVSGQTFTYEPK